MKKGEIWWANLPKPIGKRPVLLLSRDEAYKLRNSITIAEITTNIRNIPVEVVLAKDDGLPKHCVANLDTIITIRKELLIEYVCTLKQEKISEVDSAIKFALDLNY